MDIEALQSRTTQYRAAPMCRAVLANLDQLAGKRSATMAPPWIPGPAYIVGAGPSLNKNVHLLEGCTTIAVNTSLPALLAAGIKPTCVVTVESVGVSSQLDGYDGPIIASLDAHPDTFARATHWMASVSAPMHPISRALGVPPLAYGGSVTTAAFALARLWGADPIVLVGMDLSYPPGPCYATGAGWDGYEMEADGDSLKFTGRPDRDKAHHASGIPSIPRERKGFRIPAWGGGDPVITVAEMEMQRLWFEENAQPDPYSHPPINATEGGAHIGGFRERALDDARFGWCHPRMPDVLCHPRTSASQVKAVKAALLDEATRVIDMCDAMAKLEAPHWPSMVDGMLFCHGFAMGDILGLREVGLSPPKMLRAVYDVLRVAAEEVRETWT